MEITSESTAASPHVEPRPWDARLGRRLVTPLKDSWVTPNHLTTVRLLVGLAGALAFTPGTWGWTNLAALLVIVLWLVVFIGLGAWRTRTMDA